MNTFTTTEAAPAAPPIPSPPEGDDGAPARQQQWNWCEFCYLVTERTGKCPSCWGDLTPVTGGALPYGPYLPKVRRAKPRVMAAIISAILLVTIPLTGGFLLFRAGTPLRGDTASVVQPTANSPHTPITIPVLGPFWLPGEGWTADSGFQAGLQKSFADQHGTVSVAMSDGVSKFGVVHLPPAPASSSGASQLQRGEIMVIHGYQAFRNDAATTDANSGITTYEHAYVVVLDNGDRLLIDVQSTSATPPFAAIEATLLTYPNSKGPDPNAQQGPWSRGQPAATL